MTTTDCRTPTGITVSLVDTIINSCYLLCQRSLWSPEIQEALKDLRSSPECAYIFTAPTEEQALVQEKSAKLDAMLDSLERKKREFYGYTNENGEIHVEEI